MKWTPGGLSNNVEDRRGQSGRGMVPMGIGGTIVLLVLGLIFGRDFVGGTDGATTPNDQSVGGEVGTVAQSPAEDTLSQFISFELDDVQSTWHQLLPNYQDAKLVLYRNATETGCGVGESVAGPFYCPTDQKVYLDLGFFDELASRFGARGAFADAYVVAHELGHNVQHQLGTDRELRQSSGNANVKSVQVELQADCFAGVWAHSARQRNMLDPGDIESGLRAASAIGDDNLQRQTQGVVRPESFTHGSAAQRTAALRRGFESGDPKICTIGTF